MKEQMPTVIQEYRVKLRLGAVPEMGFEFAKDSNRIYAKKYQ